MSKNSEALSPWGMEPAQSVEIYPLKTRFQAALALPGSKSFTNRALVLAALAKGTSHLRSPLFSDDSYWCVNALSKLGVDVQSDREKGVITIKGLNDGKLKVSDETNLPYIGSAGTIARFLPGVIAARGEGDITLTSSSQLAKRPVFEMIKALLELGAEIRTEENTSFPMVIKGGSLIGGEVTVSGKISSQFISGLLIAAPLAKEAVTIRISDYIVQSNYVRITLAIMEDFGVKVEGVAHIRTHECDRLSVMRQILENAKVPVVEYEDGLHVIPANDSPQHVIVNPHDDHRMAMMFSVMAAAGKGATILDPSCVSKTCPNFFELLGKIGVKYEIN